VEKRKDELIQRSNNRSGLGLGSGSMLLDALHSSAAEEEEISYAVFLCLTLTLTPTLTPDMCGSAVSTD
jgi:hypothetical protein